MLRCPNVASGQITSYLLETFWSLNALCGLMNSVSEQSEPSQVQRLRSVGVPELADQFATARDRIKRMIDLRLDRKLLGRVDASDIVQEAFIEATRRLPEYLETPKVTPYLWLRQIGRQVLAVHYRAHVGTAKRAVDREAAFNVHAATNSESLAGELAASMMSPHSEIVRAELMHQLLQLVETMSPDDREVLSLKQFEELSFAEVAAELDITVEAAKKRYQRAVLRLGKIARHLESRS